MNRQTTDLLDLFRSRPAGSASKGARAVSRPVREPGGSGGHAMARRQVILASSAVMLLLVLAFVAGVGVGRSRRGTTNGDSPALSRMPATPWVLRSRSLPRIGVGMENLASRALEDLQSHFPELAPIASVGTVDDARGVNKAHFCLLLNGFADKKRAEEWAKALSVWTVDGYIPFANARPYPLDRPK